MIVTIGGFMATGKSTVGRKLADRLGWPFFDLDVLVEQRCLNEYGNGISALIERGDEHLFRQEERGVVEDLTTIERPVVIALGGGTLHNKWLGAWLKEHTFLIVLQASWETVEKRIEKSERPLKNKARSIFQKRIEGYRIGHQVFVDRLDIAEVVDAVELRIIESK